ncbi:hypothetical protein [uncultured Desulfosarcina sp.]|uniref:hypothetical protein n=1 Tax=uncultured Desulfosarcina sp. TaxID=218289 RepID=UPI0029C8148B|nr:hypothetical protein [uncultured Desulfosarcina sp.]
MSNVIAFPDLSNRHWNKIEDAITDRLKKSSASDEFIKVVLDKMKIAWEEHQFPYTFSLSVSSESAPKVKEFLDGFRKAFREFHANLFLSRLDLEIEIAKLKGYP